MKKNQIVVLFVCGDGGVFCVVFLRVRHAYARIRKNCCSRYLFRKGFYFIRLRLRRYV